MTPDLPTGGHVALGCGGVRIMLMDFRQPLSGSPTDGAARATSRRKRLNVQCILDLRLAGSRCSCAPRLSHKQAKL